MFRSWCRGELSRSLLVVGAIISMLGCSVAPSADLVLRGGKVITVDPEIGEVEAIAVVDGEIVAVGSNADIAAWITPDTQVIELAGGVAVPGFIEGHGHLTGIGAMKRNLDLRDARSWNDIVAQVASAAANSAPGEWIIGRGWHQEKWDRPPSDGVEGFPVHAALSAASPNNPVCLTHASGHACFLNAKALELSDIDATTLDPDGGEILRDNLGNPTGLLRETAAELAMSARGADLARRTDAERRADLRESIELAQRECLAKGITSFQDAGSSLEVIDEMTRMAEAGELDLRLWVMIREPNDVLAESLDRYRRIGVGEEHLTVRAIKHLIDGALGSRGAWLLEPYTDAPTSRGLATASVEEVTETARLAATHHYQLCVHAIGDRANREVLDIFERTFDEQGGMEDHRWRIEHAQHLHPDDIPRFASLGVIASMQGVHCTSDGPWVPTRLGEERSREGAYVWRKLHDAGVLVTNGTDAPVEDVDPIASYYAAVSRITSDGTRFYPEQRLTRMEALRGYTINCARAAFEEDRKGSLTPGKLADIVVLSQDLLRVAEEEIPKTRVLYTIVGGEVVYRAPMK